MIVLAVLAVLAVLENTSPLALLLVVLQNTVPRGSRDGFGSFCVCGGFVNSTPLFNILSQESVDSS